MMAQFDVHEENIGEHKGAIHVCVSFAQSSQCVIIDGCCCAVGTRKGNRAPTV